MLIERSVTLYFPSLRRKETYFHSICRTTHELGKQKDFNVWLRQNETNFTYFVPTDAAWELLRLEEPSLYTSLRAESGYLAQV